MNQRSLLLPLLCLLIAHKACALRCEQGLAELGDSPHQVKTVCGKPHSIRTITRNTLHGRSEKIQWVYDFGPREFQQVLTFKHGKLVKIATMGYGEKLR